MNELSRKIKSLVVSDSLRWKFFPQAFVAKLNTERLILRLEMSDTETQQKAEEIVDKLHSIRVKINEKLGIQPHDDLIFDIDLQDGYDEEVKKRRKLINKDQNAALKLFVKLSKLVNDNKVFDFCP